MSTAVSSISERSPSDEQILRFGQEDSTLGIVTPGDSGDRKAGIVFLNAGVLHRIGPHRLHVDLARRFAARGFDCLRLDLSGIGDSPPAGGSSFRESAVADTRAAMDALGEARQVRRFILFGLCSGADNAVATALADDRVAGLVLLDPHSYPTRRSLARRAAARVLELESPARALGWAARVALRTARRRVMARATADAGNGLDQGRERPAAHVFGGWLATLADRDVKVLAIYSGGLGASYNHPDQVFEVFPELRGRIERRYFPHANHMFTELAVRQHMMTDVSDWIESWA